MSDYNRFIPKCCLAKKSIKSIEAFEVKDYFQKVIVDEKLSEHACDNLKSIFNGTFAYALEHKYIAFNPMVSLKISKANSVKPKKKTKEEVVFTNKERDLLRDYIKKDSKY